MNAEAVRSITSQEFRWLLEGLSIDQPEAEVEANPAAPEPDLKEIQGYRRKKFKGQRLELLKDIPHDKRLCTLDAQDCFCEACNTAFVSVGEEFIPAKVRAIDNLRVPYMP